MVTIVLKSGYAIDVKTDSTVEEIQRAMITNNDFITFGDSMIRHADISAVLYAV